MGFVTRRMSLYTRRFAFALPALHWFCFMLFACALISYHANDPSLVCVSLHPRAIANWCGPLGAHVAAVCFYLFGLGSWVLLLCMIPFLPGVRSWWPGRVYPERKVAGLLLVFLVDAFVALDLLDPLVDQIPTGRCGYVIAQETMSFVGRFGGFLFLGLFIFSCLMIVLHDLLISLVVPYALSLRSSCIWSYAFYVIDLVIRVTSYTIWTIVLALCELVCIAWRVICGTAYDEDALELDEKYQQLPGELKKTVRIWLHTEQQKEPTVLCSPQKKTISNNKSPDAVSHDLLKKVDKRSYAHEMTVLIQTVPDKDVVVPDKKEQQDKARILEEKLKTFGIIGEVVSIKSGPVVALFEYAPRADMKVSKITALEDDLALALRAHSVRILAPIPGTNVVGFEIAHHVRGDVLFSSIVQSQYFLNFQGALPLILGKSTIGDDVVADLARMPHLLMAGSTGSGKSVALNVMLTSLLCAKHPDELRLILIDPKRLEFACYADIGHLLFPVVTQAKQVAPVLRWVVKHMEERYEKMAQRGVRTVAEYNNALPEEKFPYIVIVIDELADLMMTTTRECEELIARVAQMARAAGIHLIVATQRPSVDVLTGLIKVNFPSRISFRVASKIDSRIVLDDGGAERLLGRGDMLFLDASAGRIVRVHGAYASDQQITCITDSLRGQYPANYQELPLAPDAASDYMPKDEELYKVALSFVRTVDEISISLLQRKLRIGYNTSARLMEMLQERGIVLPADGGRPRKVVR